MKNRIASCHWRENRKIIIFWKRFEIFVIAALQCLELRCSAWRLRHFARLFIAELYVVGARERARTWLTGMYFRSAEVGKKTASISFRYSCRRLFDVHQPGILRINHQLSASLARSTVCLCFGSCFINKDDILFLRRIWKNSLLPQKLRKLLLLRHCINLSCST